MTVSTKQTLNDYPTVGDAVAIKRIHTKNHSYFTYLLINS